MKKILFLLLLFLIPAVYGIGIAPAYQEIFFEPGKELELNFRILNNERKDMDIMIYSKGELSNSIEIPSVVKITENELEKTVKYKVILPIKLTPGENILSIYVVESNLDIGEIDVVKTNLGVVHKLKVYVPYPGEYLQGMIFVEGNKPNDKVEFTIGLNNLGTEKLENIKGTIIIKEPNGRGVSQIVTTQASLNSKEKGKIIGEWMPLGLGKYIAQAVISYNDEVLLIEKEIEIGEAEIKIKDIRVERFKLGDIARLDLLLENTWNEEIKSVQTKTMVYDESSRVISEFDSSNVDISSGAIKEVPSYWETQGVNPGNYILSIVLDYKGKRNEKNYEISVDEDSLNFIDGPTGNVIDSNKKEFSFVPLIILLTVLLVIFISSKIMPKLLQKEKPVNYVIDPKVKEYIRHNMSQGISIKALKQKMLESGYKEDYIDRIILEIEDETKN